MARALFSLALLGLLVARSAASPAAIVSVNNEAQAAVRTLGIQSQIASRVGTAAAPPPLPPQLATFGPLAATQWLQPRAARPLGMMGGLVQNAHNAPRCKQCTRLQAQLVAQQLTSR